MTDDEIIFDFYTVQSSMALARQEQMDFDEDGPARQPLDILPSSGSGMDRNSRMAVTADLREFREWWEREVGEWLI